MQLVKLFLAAAIIAAAFACGGQLARGPVRPKRAPQAKQKAHEVARVAEPEPIASSAPTLAASEQLTLEPVVAERLAAPESLVASQEPLTVPLPIEDSSGVALRSFHAALRRAERGEGQARIVLYGASHTASDLYTGELRKRLQQRFGDAGPGFVLPGKPWRWYRHAGIDIDQSRGFRAYRIKARAPHEGVYGLAGVALDARADRPAHSSLSTRAKDSLTGHVSRAELYFLKQPGGGRLSLFVDGSPARHLTTASKSTETGYAALELPDGPHRFELRTSGDGPVRVFGLSLERDMPGVILDTLGIPGARARDHLYWDDAVYREHLSRRRADLVVLAYGTNESGDTDRPADVYEDQLARVLTRIAEVLPQASCLLVGPSDRPLENDDGTYSPRVLTDQVIAVQRRLAERFGCGFFDVQAFMGGPMSMLRWVAAQPPLGTPDHVHFTLAGYQRLGEVLSEALLQGYQPTPPTEVIARSH